MIDIALALYLVFIGLLLFIVLGVKPMRDGMRQARAARLAPKFDYPSVRETTARILPFPPASGSGD